MNNLPCGEPTDYAIAITGEKYIELYSGGIREEGEAVSYYLSEEEAVFKWYCNFVEYAERPGVLYWRRMPELYADDGRYVVSARLLISNSRPHPRGRIDKMSKSGIHIKPSHKGLLHKDLGVKKGKKLSSASIEKAKHSSDPAVRKRATFAQNARKWNHKGNK